MVKQFLEAGKIVGTHGVRGEMRVEPWCDSAEFLKKIKRLYFDEGRKDAGLKASRVHKSQLLIKLESVNSATEADLYRGRILYLDRKDVRLPKNRYFIEDLIGLSVEDNDTGRVYGELREVFPTGANNVYRIVNEKGEEFLFPAVDAMIAKTDIEAGKLLVRPIPGIFNDEGEIIENTTAEGNNDAD
jgi:16S rRNA processing protein RimM